VYQALVDGEISRATLRTLLDGVDLEDGPIQFDRATVKQVHHNSTLVEVVLHSGRNRIVRRTLAAVGHPVRQLVRTHVGALGLDGLKPGGLRQLGSADIQALSREGNW